MILSENSSWDILLKRKMRLQYALEKGYSKKFLKNQDFPFS
jgi:hypothetical protein